MNRADFRLLSGGIALLVLTLAGLALHVPGTDALGTGWRAESFVALFVLAGAIYLAVAAALLRGPGETGRHGLLIVLVVAALLRLPLILAPPFLSTDLYRYVWDGRVAVAGINPYLYVPDASALGFLRDGVIFPLINRASYAHTIYPPMAQDVFQTVVRLGGSVAAMKGAMVAAECLAVAALLALLARARLPAARVALYAWNPLGVWAFAGNGHVDALAIALLGLALLAATSRRQGMAGMLGGAAIAVKFLPALMLPPLWRARRLRFAVAALLTVGLLYLPYIAVGWRVLGFLPGYAHEEGLRSGRGLWPLDLLGAALHSGLGVMLPGFAAPLYLALVAVALAGIGLAIAFRSLPTDEPGAIRGMATGMATLGVAGMLAISPHYPWYFVWLALPAVLAPSRAALFLSVAPGLLYLDPWHERLIWPALVYAPAWALALRDAWHPLSRPLPILPRQAALPARSD